MPGPPMAREHAARGGGHAAAARQAAGRWRSANRCAVVEDDPVAIHRIQLGGCRFAGSFEEEGRDEFYGFGVLVLRQSRAPDSGTMVSGSRRRQRTRQPLGRSVPSPLQSSPRFSFQAAVACRRSRASVVRPSVLRRRRTERTGQPTAGWEPPVPPAVEYPI